MCKFLVIMYIMAKPAIKNWFKLVKIVEVSYGLAIQNVCETEQL